MFEKILIPLDTSKMAEQALPEGVELARVFDSEVNIINICEPDRMEEQGYCQSYIDTVTTSVKNSLAGLGNKVKSQVVAGSAEKQILNYVRDESINLIFMSSHGRSGVVLWPFGSTVDKVIRRTQVPLIIVKVKETQANPQTSLFKRILVALDGSELGSRVVPYVVEIADKFGSEVNLFHVVDTGRPVHNLGRIDTVPFREDQLHSFKARAEEFLNQQKRKFVNTKAVVSTLIETGNVAEKIIQYSRDSGCSLIALSSHGHSGFESWFIGSVTNKVLQASDKSVLFVPALEA